MNAHCVVVGGGIIGLSVAWELSRRGLTCTLVDAGRVGRSASWAGAGVLPPARFDTARDPIDCLRGFSHRLHPLWARQLQEITGIDPEFQKCGGVYLARQAGEAAALAGQAEYWAEYGIHATAWSQERLAENIPALFYDSPSCHPSTDSSQPQSSQQAPSARPFLSAWWVADEYQMRPPTHLRALRRACELGGVTIVEETPITHLETTESRLSGVTSSDGRRFAAEHVILCCGAWASRFPDPRGAVHDVYPVRGQVVLYRARPGLIPCIINEGNRYLVPRLDGRIYVGSNEEEVGWVEGTTPAVITELRQWAESLLPELATADVEATWSGLRPGSFDGFPHVGRSPEWENLYLATGHYRSGLHLSPGTAVVIADLVTGNPPPLALTAFNVGRSLGKIIG